MFSVGQLQAETMGVYLGCSTYVFWAEGMVEGGLFSLGFNEELGSGG